MASCFRICINIKSGAGKKVSLEHIRRQCCHYSTQCPVPRLVQPGCSCLPAVVFSIRASRVYERARIPPSLLHLNWRSLQLLPKCCLNPRTQWLVICYPSVFACPRSMFPPKQQVTVRDHLSVLVLGEHLSCLLADGKLC